MSMENDGYVQGIENMRAEIARLEERLVAAQVALGKLAGFVRPGDLVWYEAAPGKRFAAVVDELPRELGSGQWVVRLRELDAAYTAQHPAKHTTVPAAATWCLEPREATLQDKVNELKQLKEQLEALGGPSVDDPGVPEALPSIEIEAISFEMVIGKRKPELGLIVSGETADGDRLVVTYWDYALVHEMCGRLLRSYSRNASRGACCI